MMSNTIDNGQAAASIQCSGDITVQIFNQSGKKVADTSMHNADMRPLFTALSRALAGMNFRDYMPQFVFGYSAVMNGEPAPGSAAMLNRVALAETPKLVIKNKKEGIWVWEEATDPTSADGLQYIFQIPSTALRAPAIGSADENVVGLKCAQLLNNRGEVCAQVIFEDALSINYGESAIIYWQLRFSDKADAAENQNVNNA